jgi:hypothetical protein
MNQSDLDRVTLYARGYRRMVDGGGNLSHEIHSVGTPVSMLPTGGPAFITIEDIEGLLAIAERATVAGVPGTGHPNERGLNVARNVAGWHIGDKSWADMIVNAYLHPEEASEKLRQEMDS